MFKRTSKIYKKMREICDSNKKCIKYNENNKIISDVKKTLENLHKIFTIFSMMRIKFVINK